MVMNVKRIYKWHHWTGLIVGLFLLLMSITGALLVFTEEMEIAADAPFKKIENASGDFSYDASFEMIRQKYPDYEIRLYDCPGINEALVYELRQKGNSKKIFTDPQKGNVIHTMQDSDSQLHRRLLIFHYTLFSGTPGKIFVVFIGLLFLISVITGLVIYRKAIWKTIVFEKRLQYQSRGAFNSSLHRSIGVWSLLFNLLIIATGLILSIQIALATIKPAASKTASDQNASISLDAIVQKVKAANPDFQIHLIRLRAHSNSVQLSGRYKEDPSVYGNYASYFIVDGTSQKVEKTQIMSSLPLTKKMLLMAAPVHFGNFGGILLKILYCFLGLMPAILSITGFLIWRRRQ
jgi:uncharacterized iron-regulated membrane protein